MTSPDPAELAAALRAEAERRGFVAVGVTAPGPSEHGEFLARWLSEGYHGDMAYLERPEAVERRKDVRTLVPAVRSVVVVAEAYPGQHEPESDPSRAVIARYARGRDYHEVFRHRLDALAGWLDEEATDRAGATSSPTDPPPATRSFVDTAPVLERDLARRAGLGWFGRNTMLIRPGVGSYFFLGVLLTPHDLVPDEPFEEDRCGSCTACLDGCPTGALLGRDADGAPVMDARRCISYLTIELKGSIPEELRPAIGNRVFGCDICQEVCPWNARFPAAVAEEPRTAEAGEAYDAVPWLADRDGAPPLPSLDGPDLVEFTERVLAMSGKEYQRVFAGSPLARPRRAAMLRNLCVALGNWGRTSAGAAERVRPLLQRAAADPSELVREHAEWGLEESERGHDRR